MKIEFSTSESGYGDPLAGNDVIKGYLGDHFFYKFLLATQIDIFDSIDMSEKKWLWTL